MNDNEQTSTEPALGRVPTWNDLREIVQAKGAQLDATRTEPGGLARGQFERWVLGHDYSNRQIVEPPPPPPKPRPKVVVRVPARYRKRQQTASTRKQQPRQQTTSTRKQQPRQQTASTRKQPAQLRQPTDDADRRRVDQLARKLRVSGVRTASTGPDHRGRPRLWVAPNERDRANTLLGQWAGR